MWPSRKRWGDDRPLSFRQTTGVHFSIVNAAMSRPSMGTGMGRVSEVGIREDRRKNDGVLHLDSDSTWSTGSIDGGGGRGVGDPSRDIRSMRLPFPPQPIKLTEDVFLKVRTLRGPCSHCLQSRSISGWKQTWV